MLLLLTVLLASSSEIYWVSDLDIELRWGKSSIFFFLSVWNTLRKPAVPTLAQHCPRDFPPPSTRQVRLGINWIWGCSLREQFLQSDEEAIAFLLIKIVPKASSVLKQRSIWLHQCRIQNLGLIKWGREYYLCLRCILLKHFNFKTNGISSVKRIWEGCYPIEDVCFHTKDGVIITNCSLFNVWNSDIK